ncbi:hypothetical protein NC651_029322 [Populus alba x Populus x berolinensis]|nr:hypothetical protein NC651_029322 [Populus alba x Populus x berolinensis]
MDVDQADDNSSSNNKGDLPSSKVELDVIGIIRHKILFKTRPKASKFCLVNFTGVCLRNDSESSWEVSVHPSITNNKLFTTIKTAATSYSSIFFPSLTIECHLPNADFASSKRDGQAASIT